MELLLSNAFLFKIMVLADNTVTIAPSPLLGVADVQLLLLSHRASINLTMVLAHDMLLQVPHHSGHDAFW